MARRRTPRKTAVDIWSNAKSFSPREYTLPDGQSISADQLIRQAWETGFGLPLLKLNKLELELFERQISMPQHSRLFELLARRTGKTWGLLVLAEYVARTTKNAVIRYAAPTKQQAKEIVIPNWNIIQDDCPPELKAFYNADDGCYVWPTTGSRLYLAGTDDTDQIDRLRGPFAHLIVVDELGFHHCDLRRLINGVLAPQLATTHGRLIMCTTPPETMEHPAVEFVNVARARGQLIVKTIWDNTMLDEAARLEICRNTNPQVESDAEILEIYQGKKKGSPEWRREWLCEMVTDDDLRVVREFDETKHVQTLPRPEYFTPYTFIDLAFSRDKCAAVFAYFDFKNSRLVVEDEWLGQAKVLSEVKAAVEARELALWGHPNVLRYGDGSALGMGILATLSADFGMEVLPCAMASTKEVMINALREYVGANRVMVHPRCENLIAQLRDGIWKANTGQGGKLDYLRTKGLGHLDALDALIYGVRSVDWHLNPAPLGQLNPFDHHINASPKYLNDQQMAVTKMFGHALRGRN